MECPLSRRTVTILSGASAPLSILIAAVAVLAAPQVRADETLDANLRDATTAFEMQDYDRAVELLRPLVAAEIIKDQATLRVSLERLGASYWFTGASDAARLTFATLLKTWPNHPLDPFFYPGELISFYEAEKQRLKDLGFIGKRTDTAATDTGPRMTLVKTIIERQMPTIGYLMPFGVGQFANESFAKGTLLAVLQGVGIATNIASWIAIEAMKKPGTNVVSASDAGGAEIMGVLWWIGSALFVGSYTYGVVDGLVNRPPAMDEQRRFELVDPAGARPPGATLRLGPGPGLGLGISGTF